MYTSTRAVSLKDKTISRMEIITVAALQLLTIGLVLVATVVLYVIFAKSLLSQGIQIDTVSGLLPVMQGSFAGILTVVLGLELLETLRAFFTEHHVRLEVILVVAIIAVGRHVLQIDFLHTPASVLFGLSAIILALTVGYFLLKKIPAPETAKPAGAPSA